MKNSLMIGNCRICGKVEELSYEHVPPRISFNRNTIFKKHKFSDYFSDEIVNEKKNPIFQGGIGFNSLCKSCNNFLGVNYVTEYGRYVKVMMHVISRNENNWFNFKLHNLGFLKIIKHIVSMFISINSYEFSSNNDELVQFVKDPKENYLSSKYKIYSYLNLESQVRYTPFVIKGDFKSGVIIPCSEIAFPPLGHVLTMNCDAELQLLTEITQYKNATYNTKSDIEIAIHKLTVEKRGSIKL